MNTEQKVLILEDIEADAELIINQVNLTGLNFKIKVTDREEEFKLMLAQFEPDIILSDYKLPQYNGISALKHVIEHYPLIPFIVVTGSINEETAVECMKMGAVDYILKDNMGRLGQAVILALKNAGINHDKIESEQALVEREAYFRKILKYMHDDVMVISRDYIITDANDALLSISGGERKDVIGKHCFEVMGTYISPCSKNDNDCPLQEVVRTGKTIRFQKSMVKKSGKKIWNDILMSPLYDDEGEISHVIESYRDITELIEAREKILMLSTAVEQSPVSIIIMDTGGRIKYVNQKFEELTGYNLKGIAGEKPRFLNYNDITLKEHQGLFSDVLAGNCKQKDFHNRRINGEEFWSSSHFVPYGNSNGEIVGIIEVLEDITTRINNQKQIENNLEEKELLLHEIYHRVNNNMQIMMSLLNMQINHTDNPTAIEMIKTVQLRVGAMALVENMLYQEENISDISMQTLIFSIFQMILESLNISPEIYYLQFKTEDGKLNLKDAQPFSLAVNELLSNCIKHAYSEEGGTIYIQTITENNNNSVSVMDKGVGIPLSVNLKEPDTLGFTLVNMLVEGQMSGKVIIDVDNGTTVKIVWSRKKL